MRLQIVDRSVVPSDYFFSDRDDKQDWKYIVELQYNDDFKYYYGTDHYNYNDHNSALDYIKFDYEIVCNTEGYGDSNDPVSKLQEYYYKEFDTFMSYDKCKKIYHYYKTNEDTIKRLVAMYDHIMDDDETVTEPTEHDSESLKQDREWFTSEMRGYIYNPDNGSIHKYNKIKNFLSNQMKNDKYDHDEAHSMMYNYVKTIAFHYIKENGIRFDVDKSVITHEILDTITSEQLEELAYEV